MTPEAFAQLLEELLERGFTLPLCFTVVGSNGGILAGRYRADEEGLAAEFVAEDMPDGKGLALPINIMFVDSRGEAARVLLGANAEPVFLN
jgi:hypothetical protein